MLTSSSTFALQFYWHGYDAYVKYIESNSIVGCVYRTQCDNSKSEYFQLVPAESQSSRHLSHGMKVYIRSTENNWYIRVGRVSKYLRWSSSCDEQCIFCLHTSNHQPLTPNSQFMIAHNIRKDYFVGLSQTLALGASKNMDTAIGCLTIGKKKKNRSSLIFPIRFRAVQMDDRSRAELEDTPNREDDQRSVPIVTAADITYVVEQDLLDRDQIPLARIVSFEPDDHQGSFWESCPYCGLFFSDPVSFQNHKRDSHNEIQRM